MAYTWTSQFKELFLRCSGLHQAGNTDYLTWFTEADKAFLASMRYRDREFFDFVDDSCAAAGGEPTLETALLVAAVRRDYFKVVQHGQWSTKVVPPSELPAKTAEMEGLVWLPRILAKARAKLRGEMDPDTMFGCGGDRAFLSRHDIHPADFLRVVWAAGDDDQRVVSFVTTGRW